MSVSIPDIVAVTPDRAVVAWGLVRFADIPQFQRAARGRIAAALARQGIVPAGPAVTFSRRPSGDHIEIAPGIVGAGGFQPEDDLSIQEVPAGRAAHLRLEEPYAGLARAWARLAAWVADGGLEPAGLSWEVYGDPSVPVTDLYTLLRAG